MYGCAGSSLLHEGFLQWRVGAALQMRYAGCSLQWLLLLQSMGFRVSRFQQLEDSDSVVGSSWALELRLHSLWNLPGIKPVSPGLAGGFFTSEPPGKSRAMTFSSFYSCFKNDCLQQLERKWFKSLGLPKVFISMWNMGSAVERSQTRVWRILETLSQRVM